MMRALVALVLLLLCLWSGSGVEAGRILAVLPIRAKSHLISFTALTRGLAERGHEVTLVVSVPQDENHPNQKVIDVGAADFWSSMPGFNNSALFFDEDHWSVLSAAVSEVLFVGELGKSTIHHALSQPVVQEVLQKPAGYYDAVMIETFFGQEALVGLGYKLQAPVIALVSHSDVLDQNYAVGGTVNPSHKPNVFLDLSDNMSLLERAKNAFFSLFFLTLKRGWLYRNQQEIAEKYFPGCPPIEDLLANISLTVVNSHHTLCYPSPTPPNVVYAGGMHINHVSKPLPKELQEFMDGAKNGVVYFSMGSYLKASDMSEELKSAFIEAFRSLEQRVLVKWNADPPANIPSNVRLEPWLPQDDILAHPNTRLFITHGGLLSTQEAVYHGVPVLGIPIFGDQMFNVLLARRKGYGVQLDLRNVSLASVAWGAREVLGEPRYGEAARRLSRLFREQPVRPLDAAVFWVEHVMRHGGDHLRPASVKLAWHQLLLLDLALLALLPFLLLLLLLRWGRRGERGGKVAPAGTAKKAPESKKKK